VAVDPAMRRLLQQAERVAASKATVLIEGETGTGKELLARLIHRASPRASRPFVRVNCAALSEGLIESEFFGHERGSFTGAEQARPGRFELADGGTLLLDEVSETSQRVQAKLLRVLEEEEFERVGGTRTLSVDVRVVATTNRCLEAEAARGEFRRDLYYRLGVVTLAVPPLRARPDDVAALAQHFFERFRREASRPLEKLASPTLKTLKEYDWPGNVRQLRNVLQRACLLADGPEVLPEHLPPLERADGAGPAGWAGRTLEEIERHVILTTLREMSGNRTATARRLGITTRTLQNKLNRYRADGASGG
jgi:DNA-binding NtrC family response regulator